MSVKTIAFEISNNSQPKVKRTLCYELIAAAFNFCSYASATATNHVFVSISSPPALNHNLLSQRADLLNLEKDSVIPLVVTALNRHPLEPVTLDQLVYQIETGNIIENDDLYEQLERIATKGEGKAHYCLAVLYAGRMGDSIPSDYWYNRLTAGETLDEFEQEFADNYRAYIENKVKFNAHLEDAIAHRVPYAILMKMRLGDGGIPEEDHFYSDTERDEINLWALAEHAGEGDIDAIEELSRLYSLRNPVLAKALVEFSTHLGVDISVDKTFAIDEYGHPYDDDIGGPMYADIVEGINIDGLNEEQELEAIALAGSWFEQYNTYGHAKINVS